MASQNGHIEIAKLLLKNGANVHISNDNGVTALYTATQENNVEIVSHPFRQFSFGTCVNSKTCLRDGPFSNRRQSFEIAFRVCKSAKSAIFYTNRRK